MVRRHGQGALDLQPMGLSEQEALLSFCIARIGTRCNLQHLTDYDLDKLQVTKGEAAGSFIELPLAEVLRHLRFSMTRVLLSCLISRTVC